MANHTPRLTGDVHIEPGTDELYDLLAGSLINSAMDAAGRRGVFHLALSGGSTPEGFYMRLVVDPRYRALPWDLTHVWIVDERRVPEDHEKSNVKMIRETLTDHVPLRQRRLHPMPVLSERPDLEYEQALRVEAETMSQSEPRAAWKPSIFRFDFVLLGMGDDGHTASLFPNSPALDERERWIVTNEGPAVTPPPRVTMTFPLLNAARHVAVLVTGEKKAATIRRVEHQLQTAGPDPRNLPITGVRPQHDGGRIAWYLDCAAAGQA